MDIQVVTRAKFHVEFVVLVSQFDERQKHIEAVGESNGNLTVVIVIHVFEDNRADTNEDCGPDYRQV